jgi:hypothetical protein
MASKRKNKRSVLREDLSRPSKWRLQHGDFTAPVREADPESGRPVQHRYAIDTLAVMLNNGTITREMHDAGASFRRHFRAAALDTLRAMPMIRMPGGSGDTLTEQQVQARKRVAGRLRPWAGRPALVVPACGMWWGLSNPSPNGRDYQAGAAR